MQLLLAVRLAFAAAAEEGTPLPFVLDEVLSSSDPDRFRAVIGCLLVLVREGRQVFYFTCQPGDAEAWHEVSGEMGIADARRIDLAEIRRGERTASTLLSESTVRAVRVPEPGERSLPEYAQALGVPELVPAAGAAPAHLAHLVTDAEQLHRVAAAGIETYGQLATLAGHGEVDAYLDGRLLNQIRGRARVLDAFAEAWAIGRGRPLTPEALTESGVTGTFIESAAEVAGELNWDAKRLLQVIREKQDDRLKGFRTKTLDSVEDSLIHSGHLDPSETLNREAALNRVLAGANEVVKQGWLDAAEVRALFEQFWERCAGTDEG